MRSVFYISLTGKQSRGEASLLLSEDNKNNKE